MSESASSALLTGQGFRLWLHGLVVVLIIGIWIVTSDPVHTLRIGGAGIFVLYLYLGITAALRSRQRITPLSFYFTWYSVGLGLAAMHVASRLEEQPVGLPFSVKVIAPGDVALGYLVFLMGSFALHAGLVAGGGPGSGALSAKRPPPRFLLMGSLLVGTIFAYRPELFASLGSVSDFVRWLPLAVMCLYALSDARSLRLSPLAYLMGLLGGTGLLLWLNVSTGSKAYLLFSFLPLVWGALVRPALVRFTPVLGLVLLAVLFLYVQPLYTEARLSHLGNGGDFVGHLVEAAQREGGRPTTTLSEGWNEFLDRQFDPAPSGFLVAETRRGGHLLGSSLSGLPAAFVPRVLWPDKPNVTRGAWFTTYLGFSASEATATTSTGMSATGELYWNFGWPGTAIGMFGIGYGLAALHRRSRQVGPVVGMLLSVIIILALPNMPDAGTVVVSIVIMAMLYLGARLSASTFRPAEPSPPPTRSRTPQLVTASTSGQSPSW